MTGLLGQSNCLRVPIMVWLITPAVARNITREVSGVRFRHTIPGGFADCSVTLNRPLGQNSPEVQHFALLRLTDSRNGTILWEGRLEDPGRAAASFELSAFGPQAHAKDNAGPYVALDAASAQAFIPAAHNKKWADISTDTFTDPASLAPGAGQPIVQFDGLKLSAQSGVDLADNAAFDYIAVARYDTLQQAGQKLGAISGNYGNGNLQGIAPGAFSHHYLRLESFDDNVAPSGVLSTQFDNPFADPTVGSRSGSFLWRRGQEFTNAIDTASFGLAWYHDAAASEITGPEHWIVIGGPVFIRPVMHDVNGTEIPTTDAGRFPLTFCYSHQVFADLMGTRLPLWDPVTTVIETGFNVSIGHLAYPDPVTADQILTDLIASESGTVYWAAWESYWRIVAGVPTLRARAEWRFWPDAVRHVITTDDGCDLPTSTDEIYDSVVVRWKDGTTGQVRSTRVEQPNEVLDRAGLHRQGTVDAGDNTVGDQGGAVAFGSAWLDDHAYPRGTGTLTVARPVMDLGTGRMLSPWELRPGCLVQISGLDPSAYNQNAVTRNGRNVYRVVEVEFDSATGRADLHLDTPSYSIAVDAAEANRNRITRRR